MILEIEGYISMAAFMIVYARLHDEGSFQPYVDHVGPLIQAYGGTVIARSAAPLCLEGDWPWSTCGVLRFSSMDAAKAFWSSDEYAQVKKLREGVADFEVILLPEIEA